MKKIAIVVFATVLSVPLLAVASPGGRDRGERPPPPPVEALDACEDLEADDVCSFTIDEETREGTCQPGPRPDLPLACRPDDAPKR